VQKEKKNFIALRLALLLTIGLKAELLKRADMS